MSRAGPVSRAGVQFAGISPRLLNATKINSAITWQPGKPGQPRSRYRGAGIPANRAEIFPCNRVCRASPGR